MIYSLDLHTAGLLVGFFLLATHLVALINAKEIRQWVLSFPRSKMVGVILLTIDALWGFGLAAKMDLGEFTQWRTVILVVTVVGYFLTLKYVDEFLSVRALGILFLLAAEPLLEAAFLRPEMSRLLLTVLAYGWATAGLFWVGMPYILRDQIQWVVKTEGRWRIAALGGCVYGAAILLCSFMLWGH